MTSRNLVVIPERGVQLVPNIGDRWRALPARRGHRDGPRNTRKVLDYAGGRRQRQALPHHLALPSAPQLEGPN